MSILRERAFSEKKSQLAWNVVNFLLSGQSPWKGRIREREKAMKIKSTFQDSKTAEKVTLLLLLSSFQLTLRFHVPSPHSLHRSPVSTGLWIK